MRSRARYSRRVAAPKPPAIDERGWEIFTAYHHKERTLGEIGRDFQLSPNQVRRIVDEVDAQLGRVRGGTPTLVALESPVEDLGLSVRTRNALRGVGCHTVEDALRLDLSSSVRGLGRKTKDELVTMLERAGFHHPLLDEPPNSEIRILERSLERMQNRLDRAVAVVTKEIRFLKERLRKKTSSRAARRPVAGPKASRREAPASGPVDDYCREEN